MMAQVIDISKFCREHWKLQRLGIGCRQCQTALKQSLAEAKTPMEKIEIAKKLAAAGGGL
jgi:hypothetical protein